MSAATFPSASSAVDRSSRSGADALRRIAGRYTPLLADLAAALALLVAPAVAPGGERRDQCDRERRAAGELHQQSGRGHGRLRA